MESGRATGGGNAKDGLGPGHRGVNYKANRRARSMGYSLQKGSNAQAERSLTEEHATWGKSGTEEEAATGHSGGTAQVWLSRGGALKEKREK